MKKSPRKATPGVVTPGFENVVLARDLFTNGLQWEMASRLIFEANQARTDQWRGPISLNAMPPLGTPAMVTAALALELYLKCMVVLDTGNCPKRTHVLTELFDALPQSRIAELREAHEWLVAATPFLGDVWRTLEEQIAAANDVFVHWRYDHEGLVLGTGFSTHLVRITRGVILRTNLGWCHDAAKYGLGPHAQFVERVDHAMHVFFPIDVVDHKSATLDVDARDRSEGNDGRAD